jgi:hypothetical protein
MSGLATVGLEATASVKRLLTSPGVDREIAADIDTGTSVPFMVAVAVTEHRSAVIPLLTLLAGGHPTVTAVRAGTRPTALALFTPGAALTRREPALRANRSSDEFVLSGRFRYGFPAATASLVAVTDDTGPPGSMRLCLLCHDTAGVRVHGGGPGPEWGWAEVSDARVSDDLVSPPVSWDPDGPLVPVVDRYAWSYARLARAHAQRVVGDLRRALASAPPTMAALSTSQFLAHEVTRLEIELSLLGAAVHFGPDLRAEPPGGPAVAAVLAAVADLLYRMARTVDDYIAELGVAPVLAADPSWSAASVQAPFGGRRSVETEVAHRLGLEVR